MTWEAVIGLEIHVQLNTKSKLFSAAPNRFGEEPNTSISVVCTGQPGALPVLNKEAVRKAVQFGLAVDAKVNLMSQFDRKSYFYPDSPRNFQITQFDYPILTGGVIKTNVEGVPHTFQIQRAHIEDDAGMLKHFDTFTGVDYNRAGAPLIEIISDPCIHSGKEAAAYAMAVRSILLYLGVSDCNMEEGSLRMDTNISVRRKGETKLRTKTEVKNLNSFTYMELAIAREVERQIQFYEANPHAQIDSVTFRWDPDQRDLILMRRKESAADYRYFPEPDLPPLFLTKEYIEEIRATLPELPEKRFHRYIHDLSLSEHSATILIQDKPLCDYFEAALQVSSVNPRMLCNWIAGEFVGRLKEKGQYLPDSHITPEHIAQLVRLLDAGQITGPIAKSIADEMVLAPGTNPEEIIARNPDYQPMNASEELKPLVAEVLAKNHQSVQDYLAGKEKAFAFLVGQVMKQTRGKASPQVVNTLLLESIQQLKK